MAEPEQPAPASEPAPTASASRAAGPPLDVAAVEGTASYPVQLTVSYPGTPDSAGAETATAGDSENRVGAGAPDAQPPESNLPHIPGYEMLGVLGGGGMGTVFKARHIAMDKVVALKLINAGWAHDNDFRVRFDREVKALAGLEHPNVVPIYNAASWQGLPYMTMKFVAGKTLYHHLERIRRDLRAAVRLMVQVARAVHYLHANGIIHRDLKPLNILLGENDTPLVADFGLVRLTEDESNLSITLVPLGTRQYMAPEQTLGGRENYTAACDVWALGVILYELLAGQRPFGHDDTAELFRQIRFDPVPPIPPTANAPAGLEAIARKCLAKSAADRYPTAEAVANDLERWLAGEEIPLPPPVPTPVKPRRRYRWALATFAAVALLTLLGFGGQLMKPRADEQTRERTTAERLSAGETVWLIGEKGLPVRGFVPAPHSTERFSADRDGFATLSSLGYGAIELLSEPLPVPVRLETEVAFADLHGDTPWAGAYVGRRDWPGGASSYVQATLRQTRTAGTNQTVTVTDELAADVCWVRRKAKVIPTTLHATRAPQRAEQVATPLPLHWVPISVTVYPDSVRAGWRADTLAGVGDNDILEIARLELKGAAALAPGDRPRGNGLGICVASCAAVFRNTRLVPSPPSP